MQTNNSFVKIIRKQQSEQLNNKPKSKANKPKRDNSKREWK
jgi:hypothetical protein